MNAKDVHVYQYDSLITAIPNKEVTLNENRFHSLAIVKAIHFEESYISAKEFNEFAGIKYMSLNKLYDAVRDLINLELYVWKEDTTISLYESIRKDEGSSVIRFKLNPELSRYYVTSDFNIDLFME